MPVIYNSKAVIPGPLLDIRKEFVRSVAGKTLKRQFSIQAKGKLSAYKGSPNSSGGFYTGSYNPGPADEIIPEEKRLAALRSKMQALTDLFSVDGGWFEVQPFDGSASIKFQPRIKNISFANGLWYEIVDYTIDMEADSVIFGNESIDTFPADTEPEETWSIEAADQIGRTYRLTHSVSSQQSDIYDTDGSGKVSPGNTGWERAKSIVIQHLGIKDTTKIYAPDVLNFVTNWQAYNYFRAQNVDEAAGKFSVNETWLVYDPSQGGNLSVGVAPALDDFTINSRIQENGLISVTVEGTVTGLEIRDIVTGNLELTRWDNAALYFNTIVFPNIFTRAANYSGLLLNPIELMASVGRNPIQGTISYSAEYSNRRLPLIPNAINEVIQVQMDGGTDVFATIPVLGRPWGPVLQALDTISEKTLSIIIDAQMKAASMLEPVQFYPDTDGIVLSMAPIASQIFKQKDGISWSAETGKYNRQTTFVYQ